MRITHVYAPGLLIAATASLTLSQAPIPVRQMAPPQGTVAGGLLAFAHELSDGRVLMTTPTGAVVWVIDSSLTTRTAFFDSTQLAVSSGGVPRRWISLIPYLADSTFVVDVASNALLLLDPRGTVTRVVAPPRASDLTFMASPSVGRPPVTTDSRGRLIYRGRYVPPRRPVASTPGALITPTPIDTFPVVRADLTTGQIDTLATLHAPSSIRSNSVIDETTRRITTTMIRNPLPRPDDWVVLADGSVAVVRAQDYHIDWTYADGSRASSPKMPFDWRRLTDDDKRKIIDSLQNLEDIARARQDSLAAARGQPPMSLSLRMEFIPPNELPDYYPPLRGSGGVIADRDNNVWILPSTSAQAGNGLLYDVVNRKGEVFERVQLPPLCSLAGFGSRGAVLLVCAVERTQRLQRTHVIR